MIISRTPFRISFFGGGTDYPVWFSENGGAVLATTINKYCYISGRYLPPFFDYKTRVIYSKMESVKSHAEIDHPSVRETLKFMQIEDGVELHHDGDLPARSGLGSSSTFTVGLLHILYAFKGQMPSKMTLAQDAIKIEQDRIGENVGCQDQTLAAFGGFNRIDFSSGETPIRVSPIILPNERLAQLQNHLMLFFTGLSRNSSEIAHEQVKNTPHKTTELRTMHQMVDEATAILNGSQDIADFGKLLHESWLLKRGLTHKVSTPEIDNLYQTARNAGAIGGKLLGAGGGGFMLLFARPESRPSIEHALGKVLHVPFKFGNSGSEIIFYERENPIHAQTPQVEPLVPQEA